MEPASPQARIHAYYHAFGSALLMGISCVNNFMSKDTWNVPRRRRVAIFIIIPLGELCRWPFHLSFTFFDLIVCFLRVFIHRSNDRRQYLLRFFFQHG